MRILAVAARVGDASLMGFNKDIDGEAWRCVCDIFGDSMIDHDPDIWDDA